MRYTLQHLYPGCPYDIGDILTVSLNKALFKGPLGHCTQLSEIITSIESGCNAFRMLEWWEGIETPKWVKYIPSGEVFKVSCIKDNGYIMKDTGGSGFFYYPGIYCEPSSEQEYQQYLKTING